MTHFIKVVAAAAGVALLVGCVSPRVPRDPTVALVHVGEQAADIERAIAMNQTQEIRTLNVIRWEIAQQQRALIQDSRVYGDASANTWWDERIARRDRPAVALEYATWYNQRIDEVTRYYSVGRTYDGAVILIASARDTTLRDMGKFAGEKALPPQMKARRESHWFPPQSFYGEGLCKRCGVCCGSTDGHPCEHLQQDPAGKYFCEIYTNRLGPHHTTDGYSFVCVEIRRVIEITGGYAECGYVEEICKIRQQMGEDTSDLARRKKP